MVGRGKFETHPLEEMEGYEYTSSEIAYEPVGIRKMDCTKTSRLPRDWSCLR
jgi:hypothetical protein